MLQKTLFLFLWLCFGLIPLHAQSELDHFYVDPDTREDLDLGIRMGLGVNTFYGDMLANTLPVFRFTGGLYHRIHLKKSPINIYHEVAISLGGSRFRAQTDSMIERFALTYLDFPVGIEIPVYQKKVGPSVSHSALLFIGFQPSVLIRSTMFESGSMSNIGSDFNLPFQRMNYSMVIGVPYLFPVALSNMGVSAYVKIGMYNINDNLEKYKPQPNIREGNKVSSFQFSLNFSFH
jgi:hypothetical protein